MTQTTRDVGKLWEDSVLSYLRQTGLEALDRNFTCRYGEIDLIMLDKIGLDKSGRDRSWPDRNRHGREGVVFIEVRYRNINARGDGIDSIGPGKRAKLIRSAAIYLQARPKLAGIPCRFDVVACSGTPENPNFDWIRAAFDAC